MCPETPLTPFFINSHSEVKKMNQFEFSTISMYICVQKLHPCPFLQPLTGKKQKTTSFNFEVILCISVPENSIRALCYN